MDEMSFNFGDFFELSPDLLIISSFDGRYIKINDATAKTLGYSKEELINQKINNYIHPADVAKTNDIRNNLGKNKTIYNFENRYYTKKGDVIWLSWTSRASQKDKLIYSIAKDITYKKTLEIDRNLLIADLRQKNQSYQKLTYTTAHDLRSPVDSLLSIFKLIDISTIKDEKHRNMMTLFKKGSEQLKNKLNDYIDNLGKNQNIQVELETVSFEETLNRIKINIKNLIETSKTKINTDFSQAETIQFNAEYLHSIFLNLISNSIKYAKQDKAPEITIYTKKVDDTIQLYFVDNGIGFDLEKAKGKIFGLHQTFHENKDSKGIGLYLVHTHITSFGGSIEVESEVNKGTQFKLSFNNIFA